MSSCSPITSLALIQFRQCSDAKSGGSRSFRYLLVCVIFCLSNQRNYPIAQVFNRRRLQLDLALLRALGVKRNQSSRHQVKSDQIAPKCHALHKLPVESVKNRRELLSPRVREHLVGVTNAPSVLVLLRHQYHSGSPHWCAGEHSTARIACCYELSVRFFDDADHFTNLQHGRVSSKGASASTNQHTRNVCQAPVYPQGIGHGPSFVLVDCIKRLRRQALCHHDVDRHARKQDGHHPVLQIQSAPVDAEGNALVRQAPSVLGHGSRVEPSPTGPRFAVVLVGGQECRASFGPTRNTRVRTWWPVLRIGFRPAAASNAST